MNDCSLMAGAEFYVAVDNVCAWPNLTLLPNGEIAAAIYNRPSHGFGCGDVELWLSADGGRLWQYRSTVSDHAEQPEHVRMNHAVGLNGRGDIVALVSGWSEGREAPILDLQICISADLGETWKRSVWEGADFIPFGDIILQEDGTLTAKLSAKQRLPSGDDLHIAHTSRSSDHGRTWSELELLSAEGDETTLLRCRDGRWLAAVRSIGRHSDFDSRVSYGGSYLILITSADEGRNWERLGPVTLPGQHPGHLLQLHDGRIVLTYGSRIIGLSGVCARISEDMGASWSVARPLATVPGPMDCGYPSSVELEDGTIVTAYYGGSREKGFSDPGDEGYGDPEKGYGAWAKAPYSFPWHQRYHMGVCRWRPEMLAHHLDKYVNPSTSK